MTKAQITISSLLVLAIFFLSNYNLIGQENQLSNTLLYEDDFDIELRLHTRGYAFGFTRNFMKKYNRSKYWKINIGELKHEKELRQNSNGFQIGLAETSRSYIYGKQNNLFVTRIEHGMRFIIGEKARENGVSIMMQIGAGPIIGFLKPYYLEARVGTVPGENNVEEIRYKSEHADIFLDKGEIIGAASLGRGFSELSLKPGLNATLSSSFDWNLSEEVITALDLGIMMDFFFSEMPIMILEENHQLFVNVYIALRFGKRW